MRSKRSSTPVVWSDKNTSGIDKHPKQHLVRQLDTVANRGMIGIGEPVLYRAG
jgi:hypothetical protein